MEIRSVSKHFKNGQTTIEILTDLSLTIKPNTFATIMGASGSGKTTLLNICAGILTPDVGYVKYVDTSLYELTEPARARFRRKTIGYIFQFFNLLPQLSVYENIIVPLLINNSFEPEKKAWIKDLIHKVGLGGKENSSISVLSGGEMQRVAIARALVHKPDIILADEPTGNVSAKMGMEIMDLLGFCHREFKQTILLVTHNYIDAAQTDEVYFLKDGTIPKDGTLKGPGISESAILDKLQELHI